MGDIIRERLFEMADTRYADFSKNLLPTVMREDIIGVRVPALRDFARRLVKEEGYGSDVLTRFLNDLPHRYHDENMLHSVLLSADKDFMRCVERVNCFLPTINNWAVCDTLSPRIFTRNAEMLLPDMLQWVASPHEFTCRFGIISFMRYYLDERFTPKVLNIVSEVDTSRYYVSMGVAWFFATALAKQWTTSIPFLQNNFFPPAVHNKIIQKANESLRITASQKQFLNTLRR
ncbi:MAG: DNA alkylation repair protein [Bacteroidaceae bacterium]